MRILALFPVILAGLAFPAVANEKASDDETGRPGTQTFEDPDYCSTSDKECSGYTIEDPDYRPDCPVKLVCRVTGVLD